jgi:tripartite-type tricarboxylate transporter receptor subunit TctC
MRALAVTSAQRWSTMPDVPTMEEGGMKDFIVTSWAAFVLSVMSALSTRPLAK